MGGFDDIFESIDDITAPPEEEKDELTVSEAEAVTGVWNANDDGNVWSAGPVPSKKPMPNRVWNSNDGSKEQSKSPHSTNDDWEQEDEILEDFVDEDSYDDSGESGGMFDDLF